MNKRYQHHIWTKLRTIKPWYFLVLAVFFGLICIFALRANNQHMLKLREAVYTADKDNTDVKKPLGELQAYVTTHMNTDLNAGHTTVYPPIQLKYTYDRLVSSQSSAIAAANSKIYNDAQHHCEGLNSTDVSGRNRVPCIEQYVQTHSNQLPVIQEDLYKFAFVTPAWSPDLAGVTMVLAILSLFAFLVSLVLSFVFKPRKPKADQ